eukprot:4504036-Karenia_brevis.AAC.1
MPVGSVLFTTATDDEEEAMQWSRAETPDQEDSRCADVFISEEIEGADDYTTDEGEFGKYDELCFDNHMSKIIL